MLLREHNEGAIQLDLSLSQLKRIYLSLFRQLHESRLRDIDDLDEDDMLLTIQLYLQRQARQAGVDCTIHADWEAFLGVVDAPSCEQRLAGRQRPETD